MTVAGHHHTTQSLLHVPTSQQFASGHSDAPEDGLVLPAIRRTGAWVENGLVHWRFTSATAESVSVHVHPGESDLPMMTIPMERESADSFRLSVPEEMLGHPVRYHLSVSGKDEPHKGIHYYPEFPQLDPGAFLLDLDPGAYWYNEELQIDAPRAVAIPANLLHGPQPLQIDKPVRTIMEVHVRGFTATCPQLGKAGTFAGMAAMAEYIASLGVDAVQLMPTDLSETNYWHREKGLINAWGYGSSAWKARNPHYSSSSDPIEHLREYDQLVRELHKRGIRVIQDVVFNHTAGSAFHFTDPHMYNRHWWEENGEQKWHHDNRTGCGNSININYPIARERILETVRYLHEHRGVDGIRFDLATILAMRKDGTLDGNFTFFRQLQRLFPKLIIILEPWAYDPGLDGRGAVVHSGFIAYDAKLRDDMRKWINGDANAHAGMLPYIVTGSESVDYYTHGSDWPRKRLVASTTHDGMTRWDLVSYSGKRNWANKEQNRDGNDHEHCFNTGHEGPTDDPNIMWRRIQKVRGFHAMESIAKGFAKFTPYGEEVCRTQQGNNNAWCQPDLINMPHTLEPYQESMRRFVSKLHQTVEQFPILKDSPFIGHGTAWHNRHGEHMRTCDWGDRVSSLFVSMPERVDADGKQTFNPVLLVFANATADHWTRTPTDAPINLPRIPVFDGRSWHRVFDTTSDDPFNDHTDSKCPMGQWYVMRGIGVAMFELR